MSNKRLQNTLQAIDTINQADPNTIEWDGSQQPKELVYGHQMSQCLNEHWPQASEFLQIAVRAQHVKRWAIPRSDFELGKKGYLMWRKAQAQSHADITSQVMHTHGYSEQEVVQTTSIIQKQKLKSNADSQRLEDVACLVFLQFYFAEFAAKHDDDKVISIVQKTWRKMSDKGHEIALTLQLEPTEKALIERALS